jgi:hypothetical protein
MGSPLKEKRESLEIEVLRMQRELEGRQKDLADLLQACEGNVYNPLLMSQEEYNEKVARGDNLGKFFADGGKLY